MPITKPCPDCKKILLSDAEFKDSGTFKMKCNHCGKLLRIIIDKIIKVDIILAMILILIPISIYFLFWPMTKYIVYIWDSRLVDLGE